MAKRRQKILKKINDLIKDIKRNPFEGLGKPEALKYELQGCCVKENYNRT